MTEGFVCPLVMGIVNVTPDSFSGDGVMASRAQSAQSAQSAKDTQGANGVTFVDQAVLDQAVAQAMRMLDEGADLLDIGGESSRPGFTPVSADEEIRRIEPVVRALRKAGVRAPISVDTTKPEVACAALRAGADIVNDISGDNVDPALFSLVRESSARLVLMHNGAVNGLVSRDDRLGGMYLAQAQDHLQARTIVERVLTGLKGMVERALAAGIAPERLILDPGLGFGKTVEENLCLLHALDRIVALGLPVLAGPSRKSFIGRTLDLPVSDRLEGTAACVAVCVLRGAAMVRVHDVKAMARVVRMTHAIAASFR